MSRNIGVEPILVDLQNRQYCRIESCNMVNIRDISNNFISSYLFHQNMVRHGESISVSPITVHTFDFETLRRQSHFHRIQKQINGSGDNDCLLMVVWNICCW